MICLLVGNLCSLLSVFLSFFPDFFPLSLLLPEKNQYYKQYPESNYTTQPTLNPSHLATASSPPITTQPHIKTGGKRSRNGLLSVMSSSRFRSVEKRRIRSISNQADMCALMNLRSKAGSSFYLLSIVKVAPVDAAEGGYFVCLSTLNRIELITSNSRNSILSRLSTSVFHAAW